MTLKRVVQNPFLCVYSYTLEMDEWIWITLYIIRFKNVLPLCMVCEYCTEIDIWVKGNFA